MSTKIVRIQEEFYESAAIAASARSRSTNKQIEYWAKVGRIADSHPELTLAEVNALLISLEQANSGRLSKYRFGVRNGNMEDG